VSGRKPPRCHPFGYQAEVFTALVVDPSDPNFTKMGELNVVGRLAPRANADQLKAELLRLSGVIPSLQNSREQIAQDDVAVLKDARYQPILLAIFGISGKEHGELAVLDPYDHRIVALSGIIRRIRRQNAERKRALRSSS